VLHIAVLPLILKYTN